MAQVDVPSPLNGFWRSHTQRQKVVWTIQVRRSYQVIGSVRVQVCLFVLMSICQCRPDYHGNTRGDFLPMFTEALRLHSEVNIWAGRTTVKPRNTFITAVIKMWLNMRGDWYVWGPKQRKMSHKALVSKVLLKLWGRFLWRTWNRCRGDVNDEWKNKEWTQVEWMWFMWGIINKQEFGETVVPILFYLNSAWSWKIQPFFSAASPVWLVWSPKFLKGENDRKRSRVTMSHALLRLYMIIRKYVINNICCFSLWGN